MNETEKNALKELLGEWFPPTQNVPSPPHPPPTRDSLLDWATSIRSLPPGDLRARVLMIVEHSLQAAERPSVAEVFDAAYGDPSGREYWRLWLKYEQDEGVIARLLAAHFVAERADSADAASAIDANPSGWNWEAQCIVALRRHASGPLTDRIRLIAEDEELGYLLAPSLRTLLKPGPVRSTGKRGPKLKVMPRVIGEMSKIDPARLEEMKYAEMETVFKASPDTCKKARDKVLGNSR